MISTRINSVSRGFAAPHAARSARLAVFARAAPSTQETTTVRKSHTKENNYILYTHLALRGRFQLTRCTSQYPSGHYPPTLPSAQVSETIAALDTLLPPEAPKQEV